MCTTRNVKGIVDSSYFTPRLKHDDTELQRIDSAG